MSDDLPDNWEAGIGERSNKHYTRPFHHPELDASARWYYDHPDLSGEEEPHKIVVYNNMDYPVVSRSFETEEEAEEALEDVLAQAVEVMTD